MKVIDIHTHGIGGYDTRTSDPDHILRMAEIHGSHGVSEILPAIYPAAIRVMRENIDAVKRAMVKQESDLQISYGKKRSAKIAGLHIEGPFLNPGRCGALAAETFIEPTEYAFRELIEGFEDIVKIITIAPELSGSVRLIKKISDAGIIASMGHSEATYSEAEEGFHAGAKGLTHIFNAMRGLHHREPGIVGFGLLNREIYAEVIADPFHLHQKTIDLIFRTKKPGKIIIISDSVKETTETGRVVSDPGGRLLGGSMTVVASSRRLVEMGYDEGVAMNCVTNNPVEYLSAR